MSKLLLSLVLIVCMASRVTNGQGELTCVLMLVNTVPMLLSIKIAGTLGFVLNGVSYSSGSTVFRTDIGEREAALYCTTDKVTCCTNQNGETRDGQFYFPDGTQVPIIAVDATSPYYRLRHSMSISLNRRSNIPTQPTGQFRCEIPDAS